MTAQAMGVWLSRIQRDSEGLIRSGLIVMLAVGLLYFPLRPQFVVPANQSIGWRQMVQRIVMRITIIGCLIYPLEIRVPIGVIQQETHEQYIQVLLDISLSMAATDVEPSRFQIAKDVLYNVLQGLSGDSISIITFSGLPVMTMPFSPHKTAVLQRIQKLSLSEFPPTNMFVGTALGDALLMGVDNLQKAAVREEHPGAILLITDGDSSRGLDPYGLIDLVESLGVPVFALAIGSNDEIVGKDVEGNVVMAPLNPELLRQFAERTGGYFMHIQPKTDMKPFVEHVRSSLQSTASHHRIVNTIELNRRVLGCLMAALLVQLSVWTAITAKKRGRG